MFAVSLASGPFLGLGGMACLLTPFLLLAFFLGWWVHPTRSLRVKQELFRCFVSSGIAGLAFLLTASFLSAGVREGQLPLYLGWLRPMLAYLGTGLALCGLCAFLGRCFRRVEEENEDKKPGETKRG